MKSMIIHGKYLFLKGIYCVYIPQTKKYLQEKFRGVCGICEESLWKQDTCFVCHFQWIPITGPYPKRQRYLARFLAYNLQAVICTDFKFPKVIGLFGFLKDTKLLYCKIGWNMIGTFEQSNLSFLVTNLFLFFICCCLVWIKIKLLINFNQNR